MTGAHARAGLVPSGLDGHTVVAADVNAAATMVAAYPAPFLVAVSTVVSTATPIPPFAIAAACTASPVAAAVPAAIAADPAAAIAATFPTTLASTTFTDTRSNRLASCAH